MSVFVGVRVGVFVCVSVCMVRTPHGSAASQVAMVTAGDEHVLHVLVLLLGGLIVHCYGNGGGAVGGDRSRELLRLVE